MKDGFIKVAALTPKIRVADCDYNAAKICLMIDEAWNLIYVARAAPSSESQGDGGRTH